ncbi:hypothetical protein RRG08_025071 [Elysia crispata]|uniref:Uncharacterized protein n=1 Tax=Elysia crispata TaxID=231223 RepID=A0AAE1DZD3_9GAST|nr:hypothetical protein RRG08_025071 [Elysia crispata]
MYRLDKLAIKGEPGRAGLCISWIPDGLLVELAQKKRSTLIPIGVIPSHGSLRAARLDTPVQRCDQSWVRFTLIRLSRIDTVNGAELKESEKRQRVNDFSMAPFFILRATSGGCRGVFLRITHNIYIVCFLVNRAAYLKALCAAHLSLIELAFCATHARCDLCLRPADFDLQSPRLDQSRFLVSAGSLKIDTRQALTDTDTTIQLD